MNRFDNGHPEWTDRLSDYMDGDLGPSDHRDVEDHLVECGDCRRVLEELRRVTTRAGRLGAVEPSRDLWGGIAATIQAPVSDRSEGARIIELPTSEARRRQVEEALAPRRYALTSSQLAAASVVLIAASSLITWGVRGTSQPVQSEPDAVVGGVILQAAQAAQPPADLAEELATLEATVVAASEVLDPNTVRVLERNLGIIEQAIRDSRQALSQDPENDFLMEHLHRVYERKVEYLRDAARVAESAE